jgi:DNA-binding CsgD family transcriptional regulator
MSALAAPLPQAPARPAATAPCVQTRLRGRREECAALESLVDGALAGSSGVLVLRGEPGVGKTALLEHMRERAVGCRVARAGAVDSETELAFAGLHQLCGPMLHRLERLPVPQQDALAAAFGMRAGGRPDRLMIGLSVLALLSEMAAQEPLICLVDEADSLDRESAQALAFAARRLGAEPVAIVFAVRELPPELAGLPELVVDGLRDADARALLASVVRGPLDEPVRERMLSETRGNPLTVLELARGLTPAELAGGFGLPDALPASRRLEERFLRRLEPLPAEIRRLLLVAAAEPIGEPLLLWRAADLLGIGTDVVAQAEAEQLLSVGARVRFQHPLMRSAIYRAAAPEERRAVHGALADVTDPEIDPDRRAWHLAKAAAAPDEMIAGELERTAGRAQERGGTAAAAAFLEQATALTPDPARRAARALAGAQAKFTAGAPDAALALLAVADAGPLDDLQRAWTERLRAQVTFIVTRGGDAPALLLSAARRLEPHDVRLARATHLEAIATASFHRHPGADRRLLEAAQAGRAAPPAPWPPRAVDLLLDGLVARFTDGYAAAAPMLKRALKAARREDARDAGDVLSTWVTCRAAMELWDDETLQVLAARETERARDAGALTELPIALCLRAASQVLAGEFAAAAAAIEEGRAIAEAGGNTTMPYASILHAAWQGDEDRAPDMIAACVADATARGDAGAITTADFATALLSNGLGRYEAALAAAQKACERDELAVSCFVAPELVEAAVRCGRHEVAAAALERLCEQTRSSGTEWALGIEALCRALMSEGRQADALYREAIERLGRTRVGVQLARAHLLYGEWLCRERRSLEARDQLSLARERFESMGAKAFATRATNALATTGERKRRSAETLDGLTAKQAQIARLARAGHSNQQIGAQLYLSPRTVEYHLNKVFRKLNIRSRGELEHALGAGAEGRARTHERTPLRVRSPRPVAAAIW